MTIPYIPGIDPAITEGISKATDVISQVAQPFRKAELALAEVARTDPAKLQQFADFAATNPQALAGVIGPKATAFLSRIPESAQSRLARTQAQVMQGATELTAEGLANLTPEARQAYSQMAASRLTTGGTPSEANAEVATQEAQGAFGTYQRANPNFNPRDFVRNFRSGAKDAAGNPLVPFDVMTGALQSPSANTIKLLLEQQEQEADADLRTRLAEADRADRRNTLFQSNALDAAQRLYVNSGGRGTIQAWEAYAANPLQRQRATELATITDPAQLEALSPQDAALREVGMGAGQLQDKLIAPARNRLRLYQDTIRRNVVDLKAKKMKREEYDAAMQGLVELINNDLDATGANFRASFEQITDNLISPDRNGIVYRNSQGQEVRPTLDSPGPAGQNTSGNPVNLTGNAKVVFDAVVAGTVKPEDVDGSTVLTSEDKARIRAALAARNPQRR